jgi:alcohol dehydrogenase (NADP+)
LLAVRALATNGPGEPFETVITHRREVGPTDVLIDIAYCGVCHSDVSYARNEWGRTLYPLVPGHEIAGVVAAVGSEVTRFAPGDHAGVGCLVQTCGVCSNCRAGQEQHCYGTRVSTYSSRDAKGDLTHGGYRFAIDISTLAGYLAGMSAGGGGKSRTATNPTVLVRTDATWERDRETG